MTGTKSPRLKLPETWNPPSVARFARPPGSSLTGENDSTWMVLPPAPASDSTVFFFVALLLEKVAMNVPSLSCFATITAPSTSTEASRLLTPDAGV